MGHTAGTQDSKPDCRNKADSGFHLGLVSRWKFTSSRDHGRPSSTPVTPFSSSTPGTSGLLEILVALLCRILRMILKLCNHTSKGDLSWPNPQQLVISTATENFKGKVIDAVKASLERCPEVNASPTDSDLDIYTRHRISITSLTSNPPPPGNEDFLDAWYRQGDEQRRR